MKKPLSPLAFMDPLALLLAGLMLVGLFGCGMDQPPPVDFSPLADALEFVGVCSVICSLIWGWTIINAAKKNHQNKK